MRRHWLRLILAGLVAVGLASIAAAREVPHGFLDRVYRAPAGQESKYVVFVPDQYQGTKPFPLIVFLHGSGERGTDGKKPSQVGLGRAIRKQEKTFPFLVVFPQARNPEWVADSEDGRRAMAILADVQKHYRVDRRRIYLTGFSSGGDGVFSFAVLQPEVWAAMVPVCGNGDPRDAEEIKDIPCWYFMGSADNKAWVKNAHEMVQALEEAGGHPRYTEYKGLGHGIWNKVYDTPELYQWLLKQRRE
ncbi:MAG: dienelactone hydrolase family protein [Planctomycetes bacterium]|nr:dienelactone hydrolase family protein [Planctomycetota bacterium]